jgi:hypothetical protein
MWAKEGLDVFDDAAVMAKLRALRKLPPNLKPEWQPRSESASSLPPADADPIETNIEDLVQRITTAQDKNTAQTLKLQVDGLLNAMKLREAAGSYVSRATVEEALIRIGAAVKAAVMRMEADLPPMLEGVTPAQSQRIIRGKVDEVMGVLADQSSKIWHEQH